MATVTVLHKKHRNVCISSSFGEHTIDGEGRCEVPVEMAEVMKRGNYGSEWVVPEVEVEEPKATETEETEETETVEVAKPPKKKKQKKSGEKVNKKKTKKRS